MPAGDDEHSPELWDARRLLRHARVAPPAPLGRLRSSSQTAITGSAFGHGPRPQDRGYARPKPPRRGHKMAVGIRLKFAGGTQEQYQAVHDTVNASSPLGRADGLLVHSAGPIDGGWGVIDFWESAEAFDRFTQNKLMPVIQQLGDRAFPTPPERKDFTVHNLEQHGD